MSTPYSLRRYNSVSSLRPNSVRLYRSSSLSLIPRNYAACDFNSQLQVSDRYKPKWSYSSPSYRTSWPYRTFRDYNLYSNDYYDKVYNYSPVYYRSLLHNSYQPKGRWYDHYAYPHQSSYVSYKYPFNYSVFAPFNSSYSSYQYNPIYTLASSKLLQSY